MHVFWFVSPVINAKIFEGFSLWCILVPEFRQHFVAHLYEGFA